MKKNLLFIGLFSLLCTAFIYVENVITKIGCNEDNVKMLVINNIIDGNFYPPSPSKVYKNTPVADRAALVNSIGDYIKTWVNSEEFKRAYNEELEARKPSEPVMEEVKTPQQNSKEADDAVKELEKQLANPDIPNEQKEYLKQAIESMKTAYSNPEMQKMTEMMYQTSIEQAKKDFEERQAEYQQNMAEWEKQKDFKAVLKKRIQEFLDFSANIDFNAKLENRNGKMYFADPQLEAKNSFWKYCFRSGKETVNAARAYAQKWLNEIK